MAINAHACRPAQLVFLVAIVGSVGSRTSATQMPSRVDSIVHLFRGESRAPYPLRAVVEDSVSFVRLWDLVAPKRVGPAPNVDFGRYMVIVAAMGWQASTGYQIAVVALDSNTAILKVRTHLRLAGCTVGWMITHPADVVRIPKTRRTVTFVDQYSLARCGP